MTLLLALDFGGTKLAAAIAHAGSREWVGYERALSPTNANAKTDLEIMRSLIYSLLEKAKPSAIGVSFGGPVDATTGKVRLSHHVPGWENLPLRDLLAEEFGVPVSVDNDANVAALGEHRFGAGQGYNSLFYITISTGVGGGWILNGKPWRGAEGMAGEIGHMVVDPNGPVCLCGKRGCVERLASGPYMAQDAREELEQQGNRGEVLRGLVGSNLDLITGKVVSEAAAAGDDLAVELLYRSARSLGVGIGNIANLMNPQRFVLGGSVTKAGKGWWDVVKKKARETALPEVNFEIVSAALGDDAPLWGAVALASELVL
ncbi:ROK family protein [Aetokthonos hydrillicola Thurmond2011]|uniref:ROK family protein n=1 Tax=Aetokthonos hydrillicola Thurmond2011 TaxID=2712845 RepID=A0AAP5I7G9_9CYAN|nr:ROK family protein [Aetokthonos hydrillicola]MBO3458331.1 ROK family protein [Aetokthonos hydrillicola CCALA 1050]MBW4585895.1 ROK family protein [Aetokthonos hydrillicola CCALA 1050]MDR9893880.1 ROK family protein [Aetokthonos hydrillicola Thurmond2011]